MLLRWCKSSAAGNASRGGSIGQPSCGFSRKIGACLEPARRNAQAKSGFIRISAGSTAEHCAQVRALGIDGRLLDGPEDTLEMGVEIAGRHPTDLDEFNDYFFGQPENLVIIFMHGRLFFPFKVRAETGRKKASASWKKATVSGSRGF
jgi:hypothetical protein